MRYRLLLLLVLQASLVLAQKPPRPRITGVAHIALFAHDYEKSRAYYRDFLGFAEPFQLAKPDGSPSMTFFKVNERQYIELSPEKEPGTDRLNHIALEVDDAEAMRLYLGAHGIKVPAAVPKGRTGNSNFTFTDPAGHQVEIVQYEPTGWTRRDVGKALSPTRVSTHMMHVGIIVTNLEDTLKFYRDVLGFQEFWRGSSNGETLSWINMRVPDGEDYVELMLYKEPPPEPRRLSAHHLCLEVKSVPESTAELRKRAAAIKYTRELTEAVGKNRKRQLNLFDPDGTRAEIMEAHTIDGKPTPSSTAPPPQ